MENAKQIPEDRIACRQQTDQSGKELCCQEWSPVLLQGHLERRSQGFERALFKKLSPIAFALKAAGKSRR